MDSAELCLKDGLLRRRGDFSGDNSTGFQKVYLGIL